MFVNFINDLLYPKMTDKKLTRNTIFEEINFKNGLNSYHLIWNLLFNNALNMFSISALRNLGYKQLIYYNYNFIRYIEDEQSTLFQANKIKKPQELSFKRS